jgi:PmbA protein
MVRGIDEGLLVHRVMGLGQGNPISGEFSVNVSLGFKIERGEVVGRVKDVMLAGNAYDALRNIAAIGDRGEWVSAWFTGQMPYIQIGKLSVIAK